MFSSKTTYYAWRWTSIWEKEFEEEGVIYWHCTLFDIEGTVCVDLLEPCPIDPNDTIRNLVKVHDRYSSNSFKDMESWRTWQGLVIAALGRFQNVKFKIDSKAERADTIIAIVCRLFRTTLYHSSNFELEEEFREAKASDVNTTMDGREILTYPSTKVSYDLAVPDIEGRKTDSGWHRDIYEDRYEIRNNILTTLSVYDWKTPEEAKFLTLHSREFQVFEDEIVWKNDHNRYPAGIRQILQEVLHWKRAWHKRELERTEKSIDDHIRSKWSAEDEYGGDEPKMLRDFRDALIDDTKQVL